MTDNGYVIKQHVGEGALWRKRRPLLGQLDIELTERCNNNCIHCLISRPETDAAARSAEMDTAFVQDVLHQAAELGCLSVRFTGGEPLLRPDFEELYMYARRLGMRVLLFTNARRINPHLARLFARFPPGEKIEVSVYGMHAHSYDTTAGVRGAFAEFWRGVTILRRYNISFIVKASLLPPNRDDLVELEAWAATLPAMDRPVAYAMNFDLRARRDDPARNRRIAQLRLSPEETVAMLARHPRYLPEMRQFCSRFMGPSGDLLFPCGMGHGSCVDAYGLAQGCLALRHPETVYDLKSGSLRRALADFFPELRQRRAKNPEYLLRCGRCFLKGLCEQCPAKSWMEHGTLDTPVDYLCAVAHTRARHLGLLSKDENAWQVADWRERVTRFVDQPVLAFDVANQVYCRQDDVGGRASPPC
jgi:radical SAM protein with 4Fe4S-binding SPASM domain